MLARSFLAVSHPCHAVPWRLSSSALLHPACGAVRWKRIVSYNVTGSSLYFKAANLNTDDAAVHLRRLLSERRDGMQVFRKAMKGMDKERRRRIGLGWAVGELKDEFEKADIDKDGVITAEEFMEWGKKMTSGEGEDEEAKLATNQQLRLLLSRTMAPYIGFGIVDNGLMVISGEMIDLYLGTMFGISTMAAAALGNAFSNGIGMGMHGVIERAASKIGLHDPKLTMEQMQQKQVHLVKTGASIVGIITGCLIGMFPLLFMNPSKSTHAGHP